MFLIEHNYDVDGGFGDAVPVTDVIGATETREEAETYVAKWHNPEVWDKPYASLEHKALSIREVKMVDINKDPFGDGTPWGGYNYWEEREVETDESI